MIKTYGIYDGMWPQKLPEASLEEILSYFKDKTLVPYDSETFGFDPHTKKLMCFQIGDKENQFVIHAHKINEFKEFLTNKTLVGHNLKFDLKFLYKYGIIPNKVYDTYLAESVIRCGLMSYRRKKNLAAVIKTRLGIDVDKSIRETISTEGLTERVVVYAAGDVEHLLDVMESQLVDIKAWDLTHAVEMENQYVRVLAYIEWCGFKLDAIKWKEKADNDLKLLHEAREELNQFIIDNNIEEFINRQLELFSDAAVSSSINWSSSKQVIKLFKSLKIPVSVVQSGEEHESVDAKLIQKYSEKFPIVGKYLKYKEYEKETSTYGHNFIKQINPITGRLHTNFTQVMDTGRLSSGGSDKSTGEKYINFQNIPKDENTRSCFVAAEGNLLGIFDYSGQEQIVLANKSLDENLLKFYDEGMADMHAFVASKMYKELDGLPLSEIKKQHSDKRDKAKTAGFAINYGGVGSTIARNNNLSVEEGDGIYEAYFTAFPGLGNYFNTVKQEGLNNGYITFNPIIRRKSFIEGYDAYLSLKDELNRSFWEKWKIVKQEKGTDEYKEMRDKITKFFNIKGAIERKSLNYPIQGTSAEITKISGIYFFKWILENNLFGVVLFANTVHDENVIDCPKHLIDEVMKVMEDCMVRAGQIFCKRVPLKVGMNISPFWKK